MHPALVALLSALFAGLVAIGVTVAIERWGGVVGGILGTLPTTIVPAALGIHATATSADAFADAMVVTPAGVLVNAGFLFLWRIVPRRLPRWRLSARLSVMMLIGLGAWGIAAVALVSLTTWFRSAGGELGWFGLATFGLLLISGLLTCLRPFPAPRGHRRVGPVTLVARGLLAACAIAASVGIASQGSELAAGIASVFPAIFLTTMVSLWMAQGEAVPVGAVGPMMLGSSSVAAFALLASRTLPAWGPLWGGLVAWMIAATTVTLPAALWLSRRRHRQTSSLVSQTPVRSALTRAASSSPGSPRRL